MSNVNFTQGLKETGDRNSVVSGFAQSGITGMSFDDNTSFTNTDTTVASTGGTPANFFGALFDSTPTGGAAATPYVVSHVCSIPSSSTYDTHVVKRIAIHFTSGATPTAPTNASATLAYGQDGFSFTKPAGVKLTFTFKLQYQ